MVGRLHFQVVLHSSQPLSKILRSRFFREELGCTTLDLQAFFCGLLPGRKAPWVSSFLLRTMAGELKTQTPNWTCTMLVLGGVGFWIKSSAMAIFLSCFRSSFCFPHQDLLSSDRIIFYYYISPLKSPALNSCPKTEI